MRGSQFLVPLSAYGQQQGDGGTDAGRCTECSTSSFDASGDLLVDGQLVQVLQQPGGRGPGRSADQ
ncbi:hypothetical protein BKM31_15825 [[Actinomadura] parvosata subsp. kistnae]|uniref:Uncharacterized protein n=1 Tax=[Actinomadura] parvosata subsp. kistnae TaxID=1909395 RepID=A0A1U9ZXU0_9ACTN|nr:hypothetical protein BKM31_15825 [Nonomuraea sp. ATCC 55076]